MMEPHPWAGSSTFLDFRQRSLGLSWHTFEMRRPGWDATRRNRNLGTARSGHGHDNSLVIPTRWADDRVHWEKLRGPVAIRRLIRGREFVVLVEPVLSGFVHCCTPDDVLTMAELVPAADLGDLRLFVLRQPTRTEATISSVWGRLAYFARLGAFSGPAVYLEAQELGILERRRRSMSVDDRREFDRLLSDGHPVERVPSGYEWPVTLEASRATQLYRTLLHEIGHQVDYLESVDRPQRDRHEGSVDRDALADRYWCKEPREKEAFAHRYAETLAVSLRKAGSNIPFDRMFDPERLRSQGVDAAWFGPAAGAGPARTR